MRVVDHVVGYGCDEDNKALLVELPDDIAGYRASDTPAHITLSVSEHGRPKDSGYLVFDEVEENYWVEGRCFRLLFF